MKDILKIFKKENRGEKIIKRQVNILTFRDERSTDFKFAFAFDFIKGKDGKKKAVVAINEEKVILDEDQSCIFVMKSGDSDPIRLKAKPDFRKEGCNTTWCHDPKIKDEDI